MFGLRNMLIVGLVASLISGFTGWKAHATLVAAREAKVMQAKIDRETELRKKANAQASELQGQLDEALTHVKIRYRTIIKEIPHVVPTSPDCRLGPDFVRLFNRAASGGVSAETPGLSLNKMSVEPLLSHRTNNISGRGLEGGPDRVDH